MTKVNIHLSKTGKEQAALDLILLMQIDSGMLFSALCVQCILKNVAFFWIKNLGKNTQSISLDSECLRTLINKELITSGMLLLSSL